MSNQNKSVTLSPYYRLLLLASGLVIGAMPAQATQSFSATNFLVEESTPHLPLSTEDSAPEAIAKAPFAESSTPSTLPPASIAIAVIAPPEADTETVLEQETEAIANVPPPPVTPVLAQTPPETPNEAELDAETEAIDGENNNDATVEDPSVPPTDTPPALPVPPVLPIEGQPSPTQTLPSFTPQTPPPTSETPAQPQEPRVLVSEVEISGVDEELQLLVYNAIRTQPGRTTTRSQLQEDVNAIYATGLFSNVKVSPSDTPLGVRVTFEVQANPVFTGLEIETVPAIAEGRERVLPQSVVDEAFSEQYGKILNLRELQEGIKKINEWYSSQGYDLAQVVGSPRVESDGKVKLIIAEGVVENIQVRFFDAEDEPKEGRTREFIVTREMQLKPGDVFNRNLAQRDLQRVFSLGLFEDVRLSFNPGTDPREVIVNVDVVEGNTGSVAAGAGISSTSGLFGTISYQEKNVGGNNQTIGTEFQIGQRELLFDVNFTDPWIGGDPYRTSYSVNAFRRRTISLVFDGDDSSIRTLDGFDSPRIVRTGAGVTFFRPIADDVFTPPDWRLSAGLGYQNVRVENANGDLSPFSAPINGFDSQPLSFSPNGVDDLITLSFGASQDNRNNPVQPTSGSIVRFGAEQTVPIGSGSIALTRLRGAYSYYVPVDWLDFTGFGFTESTQPQTWAFNVQAGTILGDLPPYEAFILGGSNSVRGYAEGQLGNGRSYFQATAEYRFPIISAVGGALFVDYGSNLGSQGAVPGFPAIVRGLPGSGVGYGLGVRIQSPVGPIRIDFGFNGEGDSRVNFGIGEKF